MSEQTLSVARQFSNGQTVGLYHAEGYSAFPANGPPGTAIEEKVVAQGEVTFTGLESNERYFIAAEFGGAWVNLTFIHNAEDPAAWHTTGPPGADGAAWLAGAGKPDNVLGRSGDYYLDTTHASIYGPKEGAAWPAGPAVELGTGGGGSSIEILDIGTEHTKARPEFDHVIWIYEGTSPDNIDTNADLAINNSAIKVAEIEGAEATTNKVSTTSGSSTTKYVTEKGVHEGLEGKQPLDGDLTSIAALATESFGRGLLTKATAAAVRTYIEAAKEGEGGGGGGLTEAEIKALYEGYAQPKDSDLTAIAELETKATGRTLLTKNTIAALREYLELGSAALEAATAFQPKDSDLTAIAALTTTESGRSLLAKTISTLAIELLEQTTAANMRTKLGLGSAATEAASAFQPADSDLTSIAALTTTESGRSLLAKTISTLAIELLEQTTAANMRTKLALGTIATKAEGDYVATTLPAAKGDIFVATANDAPAVLTAGSNGQILQAQSGETAGLKWVTSVQYEPKTVFYHTEPAATGIIATFPIWIPTGVTAKLQKVIAKTTSGTAKYKIKRITELGAGSTTEPLKEKEAKSTAQKESPTETLTNEDLLVVELESKSTPVDLMIVLNIEYTR